MGKKAAIAILFGLCAQLVTVAMVISGSRDSARGPSQLILDRDGYPIRHSLSPSGERQIWMHLNEFPPFLVRAFVLSEDRRFYEHFGVDWLSLARVARDLLFRGGPQSGASTLSMQLAKLYWPSLRSPWHKGSQMLAALYLELRMTKGEILSEYLNLVPFGFQRVGVGIACEYFFARSCSSLSAAQMAALAVIPRNPRFYTRDLSVLNEMKNRLLQEALSPLDSVSLELAKSEPINLEFQSQAFVAPQFTSRLLALEKTTEEIQSTLDYFLQKEMQERFKTYIQSTPQFGDTGALLIVNNHDHSVVTYVGSPDFFQPEIGQLDGVQARRSPGSTLKPFLYALALENGYNLSDTLPDIPMTFSLGQKVYEPSNYGGDYSGPISARKALANSKNLPALFLTQRLGPHSVLESLRRLELTQTQLSADHFGLGVAIGNLETSLWDLVGAYSVLANQGLFYPLRVLKQQPFRGKRVLDSQTASLITDVLRDHQSRSDEFGRGGPLELSLPVAVKTGTSNDYRDTWILSYSPDFVVGIWRGNASGMETSGQSPAVRALGPFFSEVWMRLYRHRVPGDFEVSKQLLKRSVCSLSGLAPGPHCKTQSTEWFRDSARPLEVCSWHKHEEISNCGGKSQSISYVELPLEYKEWQLSSDLPNRADELDAHCQNRMADHKTDGGLVPEIIEPLDQSNYALDPHIPKKSQLLKVLFRGPQTQGMKLIVDGQVKQKILGEREEIFLPLEKGKHRIHLELESGLRSKVIEFSVR